MYGAKAERHVFLFKRALLVAKKRDDVTMSVKAFIEVRHYCLEYIYTVSTKKTPQACFKILKISKLCAIII